MELDALRPYGMLVFGRAPLFLRLGSVREEVVVEELLVEEVVVETSTRGRVGEVELVGTPIGDDVRTSTRVRVGEVVGFEGVVLEVCVDSVLCEADEVEEVVGFAPEGMVLEVRKVAFVLHEAEEV